MPYLILNDYKKLIQTDNLAQIIGSDYTLVTQIEQAAQTEVASYLVQKYKTANEFTDTTKWSYSSSYKVKNRVYLDASTYSTTSTYVLNSLVLQSGNVYINTTPVTVAEAFNSAKWQLLGVQYTIFYALNPNEDWDYYKEYAVGDIVVYNEKKYTAVKSSVSLQPDTNASTWGAGVAYTVPANTLPTNTTFWTLGDNRNPQMVNCMIDVALYHIHSRIAPHNIPDLRVKRYDDVIKWLKDCAKGDSITADLEAIQPTQGMRLRMGSVLPKQNNSF